MKKNILIIDGSSGVGLELAKHYTAEKHNVCVAGPSDPHLAACSYMPLQICDDSAQLKDDIDRIVSGFENINTLVYCATCHHRGHIDTHDDNDIQKIVNTVLLTPMLLVRRLKNMLDTPLKVMLITSESQHTPDELAPVYSAVQAGLGMLGASLVRDLSIGKVLVVAAPSGLDEPLTDSLQKQTDQVLSTNVAAQQIVELSGGNFKYKYAKLTGNPIRIEVVECLDGSLQNILEDQQPAR